MTKSSLLLAAVVMLLGACNPAPAAPEPLAPTLEAAPATPLPDEIQALLDQRYGLALDLESMLKLYNREGYVKSALDRSVRAIVAEIEAINAELASMNVEVPAIPLPATPEFAPQMEVFDVGLVSSDGVKLQSTYYNPGVTNAPGIVLLHMVGGNRADWARFAETLQTGGYGVIALDMRGHGESEGNADYPEMVHDAEIAVQFLRNRQEIAPDRVAIAGASVGANLALNYAATDEDIIATVLLSPGLAYRGVSTETLMPALGQRPTFVVAGDQDTYAANSSQQLASEGATATLLMVSGQEHGTRLLGQENGLEETIVNWLNEQISASKKIPRTGTTNPDTTST